MESGSDYLLGQLLSLVFYVMTLIIYNRARREYVGGKIADAINLIMIFLAILLVADTTDYFLKAFLPVGDDVTLIIKILLKLFALSVLFFGGLRFFSKRSVAIPAESDFSQTDGFGIVPSTLDSTEAAAADFTAEIEELSPKAKPTLGRYEIVEQIGKGAMGIVYKGRDPKLQRLTAIKTIRFLDDYDEEKVEKVKSYFYHEAEIVARLSHKNIVKIYDVGEDLDLSYLAMEYLEGDSLEKYCEAGRLLPISQSLDIIAQVCDALEYAHTHAIIHRDIKPGNIMLLKNGEIKVTDFGIARAAGSTKTRTGIIKGTPYYMSPEQARGVKLDGGADIFSLGVVLYQILSGKLPFTGENLSAIMYQTANTDPVPPSTYNPKIEQPVVDILNRALAKDPGVRYQTAGRMAEDLRRIQKEMPGDLNPAAGNGMPHGSGHATKGSVNVSGEKGSAGDVAPDSLDFTDLDQVLTMQPHAQTEDYHNGTVDLQPDTLEAGDSGTRKIDISAMPGSPGAGPTGVERRAEPDHAIPGRQSSEAPSYQVVKTISPTPLGADASAVVPASNMRDSRSGFRGFPANRFSLFILTGLLLAGLLGAGYYLLWKSPHAEKRFLKAAYSKYFPSEDDRQKKKQVQQRNLVEKIMQEKLVEKQRMVRAEDQKQKALQEHQINDAEVKQQQQDIVQKKLAEARKKQAAERLAGIEAQKKKERARLESEKIEKKREQERLAAIAAAKKAEAKRIAATASKEAEGRRLDDIKTVETRMHAAAIQRQEKKYLRAKKEYESALGAIAGSPFKKDRIMAGYRVEIETILSADDMVHGSKGDVQYKGEWMTPDALELKRYSEGFVKYKGEFIDHKTLRGTIKKLCAPLIKKYLARKYSGQTVHSKNINFQKAVLTRNNAKYSEYSVYHAWKVWTFKGMDEDICMVDIRYTVESDKWSLIKGCE